MESNYSRAILHFSLPKSAAEKAVTGRQVVGGRQFREAGGQVICGGEAVRVQAVAGGIKAV